MSTKVTHSMTVTETSTTMPAKFAFNYPVLKTKNGVLKFIELVIGIIFLVMVFGGYVSYIPIRATSSFVFFMVCLFSTLLITSLLFLSYLMSPMAESVLPKTIFELVSNVAAFLYFMITGINFLIIMAEEHNEDPVFENHIAVAVLGIVNGILYFINSYFSFKTFRSI